MKKHPELTLKRVQGVLSVYRQHGGSSDIEFTVTPERYYDTGKHMHRTALRSSEITIPDGGTVWPLKGQISLSLLLVDPESIDPKIIELEAAKHYYEQWQYWEARAKEYENRYNDTVKERNEALAAIEPLRELQEALSKIPTKKEDAE